eukprot:gene16783-biopygen8463
MGVWAALRIREHTPPRLYGRSSDITASRDLATHHEASYTRPSFKRHYGTTRPRDTSRGELHAPILQATLRHHETSRHITRRVTRAHPSNVTQTSPNANVPQRQRSPTPMPSIARSLPQPGLQISAKFRNAGVLQRGISCNGITFQRLEQYLEQELGSPSPMHRCP